LHLGLPHKILKFLTCKQDENDSNFLSSCEYC